MKLKTLLHKHDQYSQLKSALRNNLGDGFLIRHNPIYRNIRQHSLKLGFRFTPKRFHDYDVLPLTQLPIILSKQTVPYADNVRPLRDIERSNPGIFDFSDVPMIRPNQVFHESAHGIASVIVSDYLKPSRELNNRERVLRILIQEAFANACESFSNLYSTTAIHDEFLFKNSYIMEEVHERTLLKESVRILGTHRTFEWVMLSFLYANFIATNHALKNFRRALKLILGDSPEELKKLSKHDIRILKSLFKIGFGLDQDFTVFTNGFIFKSMGMKEPLAELLAFDFLTYFEEDARYQECLRTFSKIATRATS